MKSLRLVSLLSIAATLSACVAANGAEVHHIQGEMTGEVTSNSAILQSRLTAAKVDKTGDVPGVPGFAQFEIADNTKYTGSAKTGWIEAKPSYDYIIKTVVHYLKPGTRYYYRLEFSADKAKTTLGPTRSFRTLYAPDVANRHSFVVVTGMNFNKFHNGGARSAGAYKGSDKHLGYPALKSILKLDPDFFIGTGDNVYYDGPRATSAGTPTQVRKKWHEQFVQPRYVDLFARVPTYWEKDDHDFRYDDCDLTGDRLPTVKLGLRAFREQVPIVDPKKPDAVTYRTHRVGKLLQIWMPENRDYRSANLSPETPEKTVWGVKQREWIKKTLAESDATFKLFVSPTPMIGPDDIHKKDNHTDVGGFRHEGVAFFKWAKKNGLLKKGLYFVCGDRHWQYHSIHPMGFEEFSCGALVDANSRLGMKPGNPKSTDPDAKIKQPYTSNPASGGFLNVVVEPPQKNDGKAMLSFDFYDEHGKRLHRVTKTR
jgi:alkaline phosphatase/alkaline phosphatase D